MKAKITTNGITKLIECSDDKFVNILTEFNDQIDDVEVLAEKEEISLQYTKDQVKAWEYELLLSQYGDFGFSNGSIPEARRSLDYWKKKVKELEKHQSSDLEETKASRFNYHLDNTKDSFANVSAERNAKSFDKTEDKKHFNNRRTKQLELLLNKWGLRGYVKTRGGFDELGQPRVNPNNKESEENSFFIPKISKEQAIKLGKIFNQDSIFFKEPNSNKVEEIATNKPYADSQNKKIGDSTGLVFIVGQGRYNINKDKTYYSRPSGSSVKFAYNPDDNLHKGRGSFKDLK